MLHESPTDCASLDQTDQITLPPIVKHVLAPQNEFGMQKSTWSNYKRSGIWVDPPPPFFFKIPTFSRFFCGRRP